MSVKKRAIRADVKVRPFLKWAGNKLRIIERVKQHLPKGKRLVEPFAGSAAVFLNTDYESYLLCDNNKDLINLYTLLQKRGEKFIEQAEELFSARNNHAERYYEFRDEFNECRDKSRRAALFIYLNRHGYNGLCRYNASGGFNVPFGRYKRPYFPAAEMRLFHQKAKNAEFRHQDFTTTFGEVRKGDVVYCDPPYLPLSSSANFTSYSAGGFSMAQQIALADQAKKSAKKGIPVLISNHNTEDAQEIYRTAERHDFFVQRYISCNGKGRSMAGELLALFNRK
jgi:DNA adenine methylase